MRPVVDALAWWKDRPSDEPVKQRDGKFPDTRPSNLPGKYRALRRRRAKNKVARASRRANR